MLNVIYSSHFIIIISIIAIILINNNISINVSVNMNINTHIINTLNINILIDWSILFTPININIFQLIQYFSSF